MKKSSLKTYIYSSVGFVFMSKTKFSFQKIVYTRNIDMASGENKSVVCFSYIGRMPFYNY